MIFLHNFGPDKSLILLAFFWHDFTNSGLTIWYLMLQYEYDLVHDMDVMNWFT